MAKLLPTSRTRRTEDTVAAEIARRLCLEIAEQYNERMEKLTAGATAGAERPSRGTTAS
jgi:hypothetical protein